MEHNSAIREHAEDADLPCYLGTSQLRLLSRGIDLAARPADYARNALGGSGHRAMLDPLDHTQ